MADDAAAAAAGGNSGSTLGSSNETTVTSHKLANPEIPSPTASDEIKAASGGLTEASDADLVRLSTEVLPQIQKPQPPTKKPRHREPLDSARTKLNALIFLSLFVVLFTLGTALFYRGHPLLIASVWEVSLLISVICLLWANFLKVAMWTWMEFLFLTIGVLLAVIAHLSLSPKIGMLTVHLNTHVAISFLGYTLAERRLNVATEKYNIPMPANKQQAERLRSLRILAGLYCGLVTMGATVRMAWVACHSAEYATNDLLLHFLMPIPGILVLWVFFVAALLRGALMGHGGLALVIAYYGFAVTVYMLSVVTLGHTAATINMWIAILGFSGLFGYSLCVYNSYEEILAKGENVESDGKQE